jgi:ABC-2 type transport system permease protein
MRLFWELARLSFRLQLTYRAANLAGLATNFFFGLLRAAVLVALYDGRTQVAGIPVNASVTFTGISQAAIAYLSFFGWREVSDSIRSGAISADLLKPVGYFPFWMGRVLGRAFASFWMRSVTIMLAYAVLFDVTYPQSVTQWLALAVALASSWMLSFAWRFLVNLATFWTVEGRGVGGLAFGLSWFLSGFLMPLRLFPDWFVRLCHLTPFPSMVNTVVEVYLGVLSGPEMIRALGMQVLWIVVLVAACHLVFRAGVRRLVIQGG